MLTTPSDVCTSGAFDSQSVSQSPHVGVADRRFTQWRSLGTMTRRSSPLPRHHPKKSIHPDVPVACTRRRRPCYPTEHRIHAPVCTTTQNTRSEGCDSMPSGTSVLACASLSRFEYTTDTPPHRRCRWDAMTPCYVVVLTMLSRMWFFVVYT